MVFLSFRKGKTENDTFDNRKLHVSKLQTSR